MKTVAYALAALFLYAIANTIIEKKLGNISPLANTTCFYLGLLLVSAPLVIFRQQIGFTLVMPERSHIWLLALCGGLFFFADLAWFQAYHTKGGNLEQVTTAYLAFPLFIAFFNAISDGKLPTKSDIASWIIVGIGLIVSIRQPFK